MSRFAFFSPQGTNHNIGRLKGITQSNGIYSRSINLLTQQMFDTPELVKMIIVDLDMSAESQRSARGVFRHCTCSDDYYLGWRNTRYSPENYALPIISRTQIFGSDQQYRASRYFAHGPDDGHTPYLIFNKFIRQCNDLFLKHSLQRLYFQLADLEGGDQRLPWMHELYFFQRWRLNL